MIFIKLSSSGHRVTAVMSQKTVVLESHHISRAKLYYRPLGNSYLNISPLIADKRQNSDT